LLKGIKRGEKRGFGREEIYVIRVRDIGYGEGGFLNREKVSLKSEKNFGGEGSG